MIRENEFKSSLEARYLVINTEIDYYGLNDAFGEWVTTERPVPFVLSNQTIVRVTLNESDNSLSFSLKDLSSIMPKSMYGDFILDFVFILHFFDLLC